jgi:hypothetical protein
MFVAKRYMKSYWKAADIVHIVLGSFMLFMTLMTTVTMISKKGLKKDPHSIMGFIILAGVILLGINGLATSITSRYR